MADLFAVAGAKISIGPAMTLPSTDLTLASFAGVTWTDIDGWTNCGPLGDNAALITTALINRGRDVKQKGTKNAPRWTTCSRSTRRTSGSLRSSPRR
jgi:hypothetical protein